jgi:hypothetical protein
MPKRAKYGVEKWRVLVGRMFSRCVTVWRASAE